jgi:hypothetical protein
VDRGSVQEGLEESVKHTSLKPCPFCGSEVADLFSGHRVEDYSYVRCGVCKTQGPKAAKWNGKKARVLWDLRDGK